MNNAFQHLLDAPLYTPLPSRAQLMALGFTKAESMAALAAARADTDRFSRSVPTNPRSTLIRGRLNWTSDGPEDDVLLPEGEGQMEYLVSWYAEGRFRPRRRVFRRRKTAMAWIARFERDEVPFAVAVRPRPMEWSWRTDKLTMPSKQEIRRDNARKRERNVDPFENLA